jgi:hypothetical protein
MLTRYGWPLLVWLDEDVLPQAIQVLTDLHEYVRFWRSLWDDL